MNKQARNKILYILKYNTYKNIIINNNKKYGISYEIK